MVEILEANTDEEILACFPTYIVLRPHLRYEEFLGRIRIQQKEGFHLMYIKDPEDNKVKSLLGYRSGNYLYSGKSLYVDDVITAPEGRGKGYAGALQDWIKKYAVEHDYNTLSLDSGFTRNDAHRLYLKKGFNLSAHHFAMHLKDQ